MLNFGVVSTLLKIIIVEDDPMIAMDLRDLCERAGGAVIGMFHHPKQLLDYKGEKPDLAILDIHLGAELSGLDMAEYLAKNNICPHLFITSFFDARTIDAAAKTNPLAYLLKPFNDQEVITNIRLAAVKIEHRPAENPTIQNHLSNLFVKTSKGLVNIDASEVLYLEAEDIYTRIVLDGERQLANQSLKHFEQVFTPLGFIRVHRSFMVNLNKIDMIREDEIHIGEHRIPLGRTHKEAFFERINVV